MTYRPKEFARVFRTGRDEMLRRNWLEQYRRFRCAIRGVSRCHDPKLRHVSAEPRLYVPGLYDVTIYLFWSEVSDSRPGAPAGATVELKPIVGRPDRLIEFQETMFQFMLDPRTRGTVANRRVVAGLLRVRRSPSRLPDAGRPYALGHPVAPASQVR